SFKSSRSYADNLERNTVDADSLAHCACIETKSALPVSIADHRNRIGSQLIVISRKRTPGNRGDSQTRIVVARDHLPRRNRRLSIYVDSELFEFGERQHIRERPGLIANLFEGVI